MRIVVYIFLGSIAVVSIGAVDFAVMHSVKFLKPVLMIISICLFLVSLILLVRFSFSYSFPSILNTLGWIGTGVAAALFIFTLFIEIPLATYIKPDSLAGVVTTGTYALSRHPGVIWMVLFQIGLFFATEAKILLIAGPIWIFCDLILAIVQDKYIFPWKFKGEYYNYKKHVPMIVPTVRSVVRCFKTIKLTPWSRDYQE